MKVLRICLRWVRLGTLQGCAAGAASTPRADARTATTAASVISITRRGSARRRSTLSVAIQQFPTISLSRISGSTMKNGALHVSFLSMFQLAQRQSLSMRQLHQGWNLICPALLLHLSATTGSLLQFQHLHWRSHPQDWAQSHGLLQKRHMQWGSGLLIE